MEEIEHVEILLVEDNPLDAELSMRGLQSAKLFNRIIWLKDGQEALDYVYCRGAYAQRAAALPGLILLDLKMPRVDGLEVLATLKGDPETKSIPVVVMTSSQEEKDVVKSYDLGANSYVVKPVNFEDLTEVARQAGMYWLAINHRAGN
ncbi:response regulator [Uliginosibacterium sp. H3]|uniref:Response regulator n=1 Tax=Uliginosibacterium silvisoli TaxID=3114758 RepID=A0ABU6K493_9RHOO|nr:response regulator [Uliginosibacterium sp. H3]